MPEKTPLRARISDRVEYGDFSVEKVVIETYPHFYLAGNLYRPVGRKGPFPGVLNPHGHWATGRLEDVKDGSIPARCISQARMGMVPFAYDITTTRSLATLALKSPATGRIAVMATRRRICSGTPR